MKVKICGITAEREVEYLNKYMPDYAGFVFYEKSKRNVSIERAEKLMSALDQDIKRVAVTVSPDADFINKLNKAGFDYIQVHKELKAEAVRAAKLPLWYAVNIEDEAELEEKLKALEESLGDEADRIKAIVADAPAFGSGKQFNWNKSKRLKKAGTNSPPGREFILAGGLRAENVAEGIKIFNPDAVDVSSGVEGDNGKDEKLIKEFIEAARGAGKGECYE